MGLSLPAITDALTPFADGWPEPWATLTRLVAGTATVAESAVDAFRIVSFACEAECVADTNADGALTPADFSAWVAAFNAGSAACDQNGDSACTPADFSAWVANYNAGC